MRRLIMKCWNCGAEVKRGKHLENGVCYHCGKLIAAPSLLERLGAAKNAFLRPPRGIVKKTAGNDNLPNPVSFHPQDTATAPPLDRQGS